MRCIMNNKNIGSNFDDFLKEEGIYNEVNATATKRVIAYQLQKIMKERRLTKSEMARKMRTSRSAVDRLFDPNNKSITLVTLNKAATILGKKLKVELI